MSHQQKLRGAFPELYAAAAAGLPVTACCPKGHPVTALRLIINDRLSEVFAVPVRPDGAFETPPGGFERSTRLSCPRCRYRGAHRQHRLVALYMLAFRDRRAEFRLPS